MENFETSQWRMRQHKQEALRREQAARIERMGLPLLADQLHHWDQYQLSPGDLDHGRTGIDD